MRFRTKLYLFLNFFFGGRVIAKKDGRSRSKEIFFTDTMPLLTRFADQFDDTKTVLVVGCGAGVELEWLARKNRRVVAIDINKASVSRSRELVRSFDNVDCRVVTITKLPFGDDLFDVIFMHNVCEHILFPNECFGEYYRVLRPDGIVINDFAPLFYSPYGAHLFDALKIPWGHLVFGVDTIVEVRNRVYPGDSSAKNWTDMGLNRLTEDGYLQIVRAAGFKIEMHSVRPIKGLPVVGSIPIVKNLFLSGIGSVLRK